MKRFIFIKTITVLFFLLFSCNKNTFEPEIEQHSVSFLNGTGIPAESLFVRSSDSNDWGIDLLKNSNSKNNYNLITVPLPDSLTQIDYLLYDIGGNKYAKKNVNISSSTSVKIVDGELEDFNPYFLQYPRMSDFFIGVAANGIYVDPYINYTELLLKIDGNEIYLEIISNSTGRLWSYWDFVVGKNYQIEISVKEPPINEIFLFTPVQKIILEDPVTTNHAIEIHWSMYPDDSINSDVLGIELDDGMGRPHWQWSAPLSTDRRSFFIPKDIIPVSWQNLMVIKIYSQNYSIAGRVAIGGLTGDSFDYVY